MTSEQQNAVLADFREWSGGFDPWESTPEELTTFIETALAVECDRQEALAFLTRPVCTCCPGTGYRDPACDVHGDEKGGDHDDAAF